VYLGGNIGSWKKLARLSIFSKRPDAVKSVGSFAGFTKFIRSDPTGASCLLSVIDKSGVVMGTPGNWWNNGKIYAKIAIT
jgi:hypothetical protein